MSYLPTVETLTVSERVFTDLTNLKILYGSFTGATGNCTLREKGGTSGYTPSGSNSFRVLGIKIYMGTAGNLFIQQSDNDVGVNTGTGATGSVYPGGNISLGYISYGLGGNSFRELSFDFTVANTKYLTINGDGTSGCYVLVYGYEV